MTSAPIEPAARPPIPATCAHRPTVGGVVAPWANVTLAGDGVDFRSQHESRVQRCWRDALCQLCGTRLTHPAVLLGGPNQLRALMFDEPPLHPECAVYATKACPMVAGRVSHYATRDVIAHGARGATCYEPGCDCGGWVPTPGNQPAPGGEPAHDWYAVYVTTYTVAVHADQPERVVSGVCTPEQVLVVRHVSTRGGGRTWRRVADPFADYTPPTTAGATT